MLLQERAREADEAAQAKKVQTEEEDECTIRTNAPRGDDGSVPFGGIGDVCVRCKKNKALCNSIEALNISAAVVMSNRGKTRNWHEVNTWTD